MSPVPLIPGVAFLLAPGAKSSIEGEPFFANVVLDVAAEAFSDIVVEGRKHLFCRERLVGPGEGRVVTPVCSKLLWADACPIRTLLTWRSLLLLIPFFCRILQKTSMRDWSFSRWGRGVHATSISIWALRSHRSCLTCKSQPDSMCWADSVGQDRSGSRKPV